jgi:hypothetical protein
VRGRIFPYGTGGSSGQSRPNGRCGPSGPAVRQAYRVSTSRNLRETPGLIRPGLLEASVQSLLTSHLSLLTIPPLRRWDGTFTYTPMSRFCFRITFQNEDAAFYQFHVFPPVVHIPWVSGWARKRNASTQLILVEVEQDEDRDRFLEICCENPHVLKIEEISEAEFTATPSQAI